MVYGQNNLNQSVFIYFFPEMIDVFDPDIMNCRLYAPLNIALTSEARQYRKVYLFDLFNFASIVNNGELGATFSDDITLIGLQWHKLLVSNISHEPQMVYKRTDTIYPLNVLTLPDPKAQKIEGSIKTNSLIPFGNDPNALMGFQALWRLSVFPFVPFMLASTIKSSVLSGPLFVRRFNISVENEGNVEIDMSFIGGKSLVSPIFNVADIKAAQVQNIIPFDLNIYRTAKMADCFYCLTNYGNLDSSVLSVQNQILTRNFQTYMLSFADKIIKIELNISQEIEPDFVFTNTTNVTESSLYLDIPQNTNGPKYMSLGRRDVTGSFTFFSYQQPIIGYNELQNSLILYFGGPFYYPLEKIDFQINDMITESTQSGYISKLPFIASIVNDAEVLPTNNENYSSEFKIPNYNLYNPIGSSVQIQ